MATIVTRAGKGSPLTNAEVDDNFTSLNNQLATALFGANNLSDLANVSTARSNLGVAIGINVQAWDADLDAIAALAGATGFLKKTAANTWALDTSTYLTGITSGQVTTALGFTPYNATNPAGYTTNLGTVTSLIAGTGLSGGTISTSGTIALANTAVTPGSYTTANITVDAQGRITAAASGSGGVTTFNTRSGAVTLSSADVTTALGFTPPQPTGTGASGTWGINISGTASVATNVTIVSDTATATSQFVGFYAGTSGNGSPKASTGLTFIPSSGALTASGNITAFSDENLKTDWQDISEGFVEHLAALRTGTYTRIDTGERQVGVSAQSLRCFLPEAVNDGKYLSVAYGNAALVSSVALARRMLELTKRIKALEGQGVKNV